MHKKVVIHGCYNNANFGDILIVDLLRRHLRKSLGISAVCPWLLGVKDGKRYSEGKGWLDVVSAGAGIFGGGGYFQNNDNMLRRYLYPAKVWQARHVPYIVVGAGAGPILTGICAERARIICELADWVYVRDNESRELILKAGVTPEKVEATADLVVHLNADDIPFEAGSAADALLGPSDAARKRLALHFPDYPGARCLTNSYPFYGRSANLRMVEIVKTIAQAIKGHDEEVEIFWLEFGGGRSTAQALRVICQEHLPQSRFVPFLDHWTAAAVLARMDGVMTSMLHVGITAWALGTPCAAYASHQKTPRFYRQVGRNQFCASREEPIGILKDWVEVFLKDYTSFAHRESPATADLRQLASKNYLNMTEWVSRQLQSS